LFVKNSIYAVYNNYIHYNSLMLNLKLHVKDASNNVQKYHKSLSQHKGFSFKAILRKYITELDRSVQLRRLVRQINTIHFKISYLNLTKFI